MKRITFVLSLLLASNSYAQQQLTTTTITATMGGNVNCIGIVTNVTRTQDSSGSLQTWINFTIRQCQNGETIPTYFIASYNSKIPDSDFTTDRLGARVITNSPYGKVDLTWVLTKDNHTSYNATWMTEVINQSTIKQSQNDETTSAKITGVIGSYIADRPGYFQTSSVKK